MYELPQAKRIARDSLVKRLDPYGYHSSRKTPGLWTHKNQPINFMLLFNDLGVKYLVKEHALHLKEALEHKFMVTTDKGGKLYIGVALK